MYICEEAVITPLTQHPGYTCVTEVTRSRVPNFIKLCTRTVLHINQKNKEN